MTTRRLLLLVDGLPHGSSRFWSAVLDRDPVTDDQIILSDIFMALTKNVHPVRTRREDAKKRREMEAKKARVAKRERRRRRYRTTT